MLNLIRSVPKKVLASVAMLAALGVGAAVVQYRASCCHTGAACCYPGSPCCQHGQAQAKL